MKNFIICRSNSASRVRNSRCDAVFAFHVLCFRVSEFPDWSDGRIYGCLNSDGRIYGCLNSLCFRVSEFPDWSDGRIYGCLNSHWSDGRIYGCLNSRLVRRTNLRVSEFRGISHPLSSSSEPPAERQSLNHP
jgi:predicted heme/steroid binding protein